MGRKIVFLILSFALAEPALANESGKDLKSPEAARLCNLLLRSKPQTVWLSGGRTEILDSKAKSFLPRFPQKALPLTEVLLTLPYGRDVAEEIPELYTFVWQRADAEVNATFFTRSGNEVTLRLQRHGYFDIKIGPSLELHANRHLYEFIVNTLHLCGGHALIFSRPILEPSDTGSEMGLWLTHLEIYEPQGRRCIRQILGVLSRED